MVEKMNEKQGDRIRFFLSKADTAGHESDRQVCQTDAMMHALSKKIYWGYLVFWNKFYWRVAFKFALQRNMASQYNKDFIS